jgi:hypothetical protein
MTLTILRLLSPIPTTLRLRSELALNHGERIVAKGGESPWTPIRSGQLGLWRRPVCRCAKCGGLLPWCYPASFRDFCDIAKLLILMEPAVGLEPTTY